MNITISDATFADVQHLVQMTQDMHLESPVYREFNFHTKKYIKLMLDTIQSPNGILLVAKDEADGNEIVGFFVGAVHELFFSSDKVASDMLLYVEPEYRKSGVAGLLIKKYIQEAKSAGAKEIRLATTTGVLTEQTEALYKHRGFESVGGNFILKGEM